MMIKVLLIVGLVGAAALMLRGPAYRQQALRRLGGIAVAGTGIVTVLWPDLTTRAAQLVGVGRGTDLVLYLAVLAFTFMGIALYERIARMEQQITSLTRELALRSAEPRPEVERTTR